MKHQALIRTAVIVCALSLVGCKKTSNATDSASDSGGDASATSSAGPANGSESALSAAPNAVMPAPPRPAPKHQPSLGRSRSGQALKLS